MPMPRPLHTDLPTLAQRSKPRVIYTYPLEPMRSRAGTHTCRHNRGTPGSRPSSTGSHALAAANRLQEQWSITHTAENWGAPVRACVPARRGPTPVPKQDPALTGLQPQITERVPRPSGRAGTNAHTPSKSSRARVGVSGLPCPGCGTQNHRPWPKGAHPEKEHIYINPPAPLRSRAHTHTRGCCRPPPPPPVQPGHVRQQDKCTHTASHQMKARARGRTQERAGSHAHAVAH